MTRSALALPFWEAARARWPSLLPEECDFGPDLEPGGPNDDSGLSADGRRGRVQLRSDYPPPRDLIGGTLYDDSLEKVAGHAIGHVSQKWMEASGIDVLHPFYAFRGFRLTPEQQEIDADAMDAQQANSGWGFHPREQWAEFFGAALSGRWIVTLGASQGERTFNDGRPVDALDARAFIDVLLGGRLMTPGPLRVLWHLSHHSPTRPDGWSGAPDEARWIREELTPRVLAACGHLGIQLVLVDGDGSPTSSGDHPQFHDDYLAFVAPHYEANIHEARGWFWGRAAQSLTADEDDRLGRIFERRYGDLCERTGGPPMRFDWLSANVTDYYGFRLTSASTPGILVEHGVGWNSPADYDFTWLREHVQEIADGWALTLIEFAGGGPPEEGDMTKEQFREWFLDIYRDIGVAAKFDALAAVDGELLESIRKLAANEAVDDAEVAALKARIDKLRTI